MKLNYLGGVQDGVLKLSDRKRFDQDIKQFEGKRIEVTIQKAKKNRSNGQNAFLWGVCYPCAVQGFIDAGNIGVTVDEVHTFFKARFLSNGKDVVIPGSGEMIRLGNTTSTLSTTEMMDYIEQIAKFCAEMLNVVIPEPTPIFSVE